MTPGAPSHTGATPPAVSVSALVVNYHAYDELAACLRSLEGQPALVDVVVVDHATVPNARASVERHHPGVCWLPRADNPGFGAGVNRAAQHATGNFLYVVNPDAVVAPGAIEVLARWLAAHPDFGVAGSLVRETDGAIQGSARAFPAASTLVAGRSSWLTRRFPANPWSRRNVLTGPAVQEPRAVDWVSGASMMIRRDAFSAVGGFDARYFLYWEDADLCRRLLTLGWQTAYVPQSVVTHHGGRSSRSALRPLIAFHQSALRYHVTHSGPLGRVASPLVALALGLRLGWKIVTRPRDPGEDGP
jgi:N-acetylglucosaminyl-diphospho-decaprenol L-rhamnosyltransferase